MNVTVRLFASFREAAGETERRFEVAPGATVGSLWEDVIRAYPRLAPLSRIAAFAVNMEYARPGDALTEGDEVAFLPPVSGG
jgi:molybdopterin converting factor subunit 1